MTTGSSRRRSLSDEEQQWADNLNRQWAQRADRSLSQSDAADELGYAGQSTVSQYINGVVPLNTGAILAFAELLGIQPGQINPKLAHITIGAPPPPPAPKTPGASQDLDSALEAVIDHIHSMRCQNLAQCMVGMTTAEFARIYDLDPTYISQLLNRHRNFGEKAARRLELSLGLTIGTLDASALEHQPTPQAGRMSRNEEAAVALLRRLNGKKQQVALRILGCLE